MGEIRIKQQSPTLRVDYADNSGNEKHVADISTGFPHGVDWSAGIKPIVEKGVITGWVISVMPKKGPHD